MKKILIFIAASFFMLHAEAQVKIDRSKKPASGPAPVISFKDPAMFTMPNGMTVLVVEDHSLPKVSASLQIDQGPIKEGKRAGVTSLMGQMLEEGTKTMDKASYDQAVEYIGASVSVNSSGGYAGSLTRYFDKALGYMSDALQNPSFPEDALKKLKTQTITGLKNADRSAATVANRVKYALSFGKNTALGEFTTPETIEKIEMEDIKEAYKNYITPSRSYLTFVGDITPAKAKELATKYFGKWTGKKLELPTIADVKNPSTAEIDFVNMPTAVQAQISVGNVVTNPMNGKDYFALLLANQVLGGGADGKLFLNLREKRGFTYGSYSSVGSGRFPALFNASAEVRTDKADSAVQEIVNEIVNVRNGKFTQEELDLAKAKVNGSFALGMEDPANSARYATNILINNLPKDFYRTYLQKLNAVTITDVQRVAADYFNHTNGRIVIVGNAEKIIPNLQRLGYPIKRYDIYAEPVAEEKKDLNADASSATTDKVSAYDIIQNYLKAIGGKEAVSKIKTMSADLSVAVMGQNASGTMKMMNPNMSAMEIKMGSMTVAKSVFNGLTGYQSQMGQKKDMTMEEITEEKDDAGIFPELNYTSGSGYSTEYIGAGKVNGEATYRLKVKGPSGKVSVKQYSIKTGLLLQSETTTQGDEGEQVTLRTYSDYKKVGDVLFPHTMILNTGGLEITNNIDTLKFNEGVTEKDFE